MLLRTTLERLTPREPRHSGALGMLPLCEPETSPADDPAPYDLLADALRAGTIVVTEVSEGGSVPELLATNAGPRDVLLVDGEELLGAKQNRMLNLSVLVPAGRTIRIPVSCVERGRWHHASPAFAESPNTVHPRVRAAKARQVTDAMRRGSRHSDQMAVWEEIDRKAAAMRVRSETSALSDVYATYAGFTADAVAELAPSPGQVGAVFTIGGEVVGVELFDHPRTFATYLPKIVRGYALDALEPGPRRAARASTHSVDAFLQHLAEAPQRRYPAIGTGEDVRIDADAVAGGALVAHERVVHLTAMYAT